MYRKQVSETDSCEGGSYLAVPADRAQLYVVSGLPFTSTIPFPELVAGSGEGEFAFTLSDSPLAVAESEVFHSWLLESGKLLARFSRRPRYVVMDYVEAAFYTISYDGRTVTAFPKRKASLELVRFVFLSQVVPLLHCLRSHVVVHASAVVVGGRAVGFCGVSGSGKSTLALSFAAAGYPFLCDEVLRLDVDAGGPVAVPGFPSLRLFTDSLEAVQPDAVRMPEAAGDVKPAVLTSARTPFHGERAPLGALYFLDPAPAETPSITPLGREEALVQLRAFSFMLDLDGTAPPANRYTGQEELAKYPVYFRLSYPRSFAALGAVRDLILAQQTTLDS